MTFDKKLNKAYMNSTFKRDVPTNSKKLLIFCLILLCLVFLSFNSNAAQCVGEDNIGYLILTTEPIETCSTGLIILSKSDYDAINIDSIVATLIDLFEFSVEDFAMFNASCLIVFITGHSIGRVCRILGKS